MAQAGILAGLFHFFPLRCLWRPAIGGLSAHEPNPDLKAPNSIDRPILKPQNAPGCNLNRL